MGVPQGGVVFPILLNNVLEILLRFINTQAAALGVNMAAKEAHRKWMSTRIPPAIQILVLAYADAKARSGSHRFNALVLKIWLSGFHSGPSRQALLALNRLLSSPSMVLRSMYFRCCK
jgi:hypothetical protein